MKLPTTLLPLLAAVPALAAPQAPQTTRIPVPVSQPHSPTHPGTPSTCRAYYKISEGDICLTVASAFGITVDQLASWNSVGGRDCPYLALGYYACVAVAAEPSSPTPTPTTSGVVATPTPTQAGVVGDCVKWHYLEVGDVCFVLAGEYGIEVGDVVRWNPAAGGNCAGLKAGYWACVGVNGGGKVGGDTAASGYGV